MKLHIFFSLGFCIFGASLFASEWYARNEPSLPAPEVVGTIGLKRIGKKVFYKKLVARNFIGSTEYGDCYQLYFMNYIKDRHTYEVRCHHVFVNAVGVPFFSIPQLVYDGDAAQKRFEEIEKRFKQQN